MQSTENQSRVESPVKYYGGKSAGCPRNPLSAKLLRTKSLRIWLLRSHAPRAPSARPSPPPSFGHFTNVTASLPRCRAVTFVNWPSSVGRDCGLGLVHALSRVTFAFPWCAPPAPPASVARYAPYCRAPLRPSASARLRASAKAHLRFALALCSLRSPRLIHIFVGIRLDCPDKCVYLQPYSIHINQLTSIKVWQKVIFY